MMSVHHLRESMEENKKIHPIVEGNTPLREGTAKTRDREGER